MSQPIAEGDYTLADGTGWFGVRDLSIRIRCEDGGVAIEVYRNGDEMGEPIDSLFVGETDPHPEREDHFRDDVEADADALASAGYGTDEDYGHYGGDEL